MLEVCQKKFYNKVIWSTKRFLKNFSGDVRKTAIKKVLENFQKKVFSSVAFRKLELSNRPTYNNSKTDSTANISFVCFENFKIAWRSFVVESLFSKVTETSGFYNSAEKSEK